MNVRCMGCRGEVSEWAAHCPRCGRGLDDAELVPAPEPVEVAASEGATNKAAAVQVKAATDDAATDDAAGQDEVAAAIDEAAGVEAAPGRVALATTRRGLGPKRVSRRRLGLMAVAVIAVPALALGVFDPGHGAPTVHKAISASQPAEAPLYLPQTTLVPSTAHEPHGSLLRRIPAGLASELLFFAEPKRTGLYRADGLRMTDLGGAAGVGYPLEPLVSSRGIVVYIHGNYAYRTDPRHNGRVVRLGLATWIFPAQHGAIGIESEGQDARIFVEYMAADGTFPEADTRRVELPPLLTAVAQVPSGLVVASGAVLEELLNGVASVQLSIIKVHSTASLGTATTVIGVSGATVALVSCPDGRSTDCELQLVNTTTRHVQTIRPPPGHGGFAPGGGFSPDGKLLATFVPSRTAGGARALHLVVVRLSTGTASVVRLSLSAGDEPVGDATWSADGRWLYFGGVTGALDAEQITPTGPLGHPWTLPLTTSLAVIGD